ncbi:hypothetical protein TNCV_1122361 [Trichonephila clavipes]|nr:hypothetical protein TNCV_1122361 [Trichonephila clavipes]
MKKVINQEVVNPPVTARQAETRHDIESRRSPMSSCGRSCHKLYNWEVNSPVFRMAAVAFQARPRCALLDLERSGDPAGYRSTSYP